MHYRVLALTVTLALIACTPATGQADWQLNNNLSRISFVSIKATHVAEAHKFTRLKGGVADGQIRLEIDLSSVDTLIPIRDERMQEFLFEVGLFPTATVTTAFDQAAIDSLGVGSSQISDVSATLTLKDQAIEISANLMLTRVSATRVQVHSLQPLLLNVGAVGLTDGVEKLRELAGLPSISQAVPVTLSLTFDR
ncbi:MAG: YceI family protein [Pseudomonadota bacterium]